ncbi:hypothetical protein NOVOSPHI9U_310017 [Novosphingobium sp. 9U]|nr:hypothetical protein NOVOSPHI9U_310017 [Novosphingobium sp. 9U]
MLVAHQARLIGENGDQGDRFDTAPGLDQQDIFAAGPWPLIYGFSQTFRSSINQYADLWQSSISHFSPAEQMGHDRRIAFIAANMGEVRLLDSELVLYRQHSNNLFGGSHSKLEVAYRDRSTLNARRKKQALLIARAAEDRTLILESLLSSGVMVPATYLNRFRSFLRIAKHRANVYSPLPRRTKLAAIGKLVCLRAYGRSNRWRFPPSYLLDDLRNAVS